MSNAGPPTGARISVLALCSMAHPVFSVSPLLVHPRSAQSLPWRRARGRQKTPSEKNTDAVSSLLAAYPPLANVTAEADMLRTGGGLCATGLARRGVCCAATCATCGGRGCGRPANASGVCCKSSIVAERRPPPTRGRAGRAIRTGPESTALRATGRRRVRAPGGAGGDRRRRRRRRDFRAAERVVVAVAVKQLLRCRVDTARRRALDRGGTRGAAMRDGGRRVLRGARRVPLDRAGAAPGARRALLRRRRRRRGVAEVCAVGRGGRGPASSSFLYSGWR